MKNFISLCLLTMMFTVTNTWANYNYTADIFRQMIQNPSIQSCSVGNDIRSAEGRYQKQDIVGRLPYIRSYSTALDDSAMLKNDIYDGFNSIAGWRDNYFNYLSIHDFGGKNTDRFRIQVILPGEQLQTYYSADITNGAVGTIKRIYSPQPDVYWAVKRNGSSEAERELGVAGSMLTDHRDKTLHISRNKTNIPNSQNVVNAEGFEFYVFHQGATYRFNNIYRKGDAAVYKATVIIKPDGQQLSLKYSSSNGALQRVVDQYGNFLEVRAWEYDSDTDPVSYAYPKKIYAGRFLSISSDYLNQPIKSQELNVSQSVTFTYGSQGWYNYNKNNRLENIYRINSATSTNFGTENYSYDQVAQVSSMVNVNGYLVGRWTNGYRVPALTHVKDQLGRTIASFNYNNTDPNWWTNMTTVTGSGGLWKTERELTGGHSVQYGNWHRTYKLNFYTGNTKDKDFDAMTLRLSGGHKSSHVEMNMGGYPCLTYNDVPVSKVIYNVIYDTVDQIEDRKGYITKFTYDHQNRLATVTEAVGTTSQRITKYTYSSDIKNFLIPTKIEHPLQTIVNTLSTTGQVLRTTVSYPNSTKQQITTYGYHNDFYKSGLLNSITYPDGAIKGFGYTTTGGLLASESFYKDRWMTTNYSAHNSAGQPSRIDQVEKNGRQVIEFDSNNRPKWIRDYDLSTNTYRQKSYTYDTTGLVLTEVDEDGVTTKYTYNPARMIHTNTVGTVVDTHNYNANAQLISVDRKDGSVNKRITTNIYDRNGRLYEGRIGNDATQMWKRYEYDLNGNVAKMSHPDATGEVAHITYNHDPLNRQSDFTNELGYTYDFDYDALDNVTLQKAPNAFNSTNKFINGKELDIETNTDFSSKRYTYDIISNPLTMIHASDRLCTYSGYDVENNFQKVFCQKADRTTSNYDVNYDYGYHNSRLGRLDKVESKHNLNLTGLRYWGANTYYYYDGYDRLIGKDQHVGMLQTSNTPKKLTVGYSYTHGDRIQSMTYPSGKVIEYGYDFSKSGNISHVKINGSNLLNTTYEQGLLRRMNWANGSSSEYRYDAFSRLSNIINTINGNTSKSISLNYFQNGLVEGKAIAGVGFTYGYDAAGQLVVDSRGGDVNKGFFHVFQYDKNGNRTLVWQMPIPNVEFKGSPYPAKMIGYTYQANTNKLTTIIETTGNTAKTINATYRTTGEMHLLTELGSAGYDYMGRRLWQAASPSGKYASHTMQYNHKNERVYSGLTGTLARQYIYDESGHLLGEYSTTGTAYVEYVWMGDQPIAALYPNNKVVYLFTDHKNTPVFGVDSVTKASVWEWYPDAFGVAKPSLETVKMNLRFPGQYYDTTTGLHYNLNRYYNPMLGRYMEADPIGLDGGWNPYAYAGNDPVNHVDPDGLTAIKGLKLLESLKDDIVKPLYRYAKESLQKDQAKENTQKAATSREARREVMRQEKIPTSSQPKSQSKNDSGREYTYEVNKNGGGTEIKSVQQQTLDRSHQGQPHWEAGRVKVDPRTGQVRTNQYGRAKLQQGKSKVDY